jgi:hypothetical protein
MWYNQGQWVQGKNFFSDTLDGVKFWVDKMQNEIVPHYFEFSSNHPNNFVRQGMVPIILRFRFNPRGDRWQGDSFSDRPGGDYYARKVIQSEGIQAWNGSSWVSMPITDGVSLKSFVGKRRMDASDHRIDYTTRKGKVYDSHGREVFMWDWKEPYPFPPS